MAEWPTEGSRSAFILLVLRTLVVVRPLRYTTYHMVQRNSLYVAAALLITAIISGCASQIVPEAYRARDDYDAYTRALEALELDTTELGRAWVATGEGALHSPISISSSAFEVGYFNPYAPDAAGFAFTALEGKTIAVTVTVDDRKGTILFADLFRRDQDGELRHVASAGEDDAQLVFETRRPGSYVLRIQPELLRGGRYFLTIKTDASLGFPVEGAGTDAIWSFFGDPRDGGERDHHGVDIFAPRGTPVLSPTAGEVVHVRWNKLGGNTVGVWDANRRIYYYFAHLEEQLVEVGRMVEVGDVLGLVGNTGNAETTPPHLHFGMYVDMRDPIDPYHFITRVAGTLGPVEVDEDPIGLWSRTSRESVPLYVGPEGDAQLQTLPQFLPLLVTGAQGTRYRVLLPDGARGYLDSEVIEPTDAPIAVFQSTGTRARVAPRRDSDIVAELAPGTEVAVLGLTEAFVLAVVDDLPLWIERDSLEDPPNTTE